MRRLRILTLLPLLALLGACNLVVMAPSGDVAAQQRDLIIVSTVLMLLIIIPVMALTVFFAWRYRQSNKAARYDPDWHHSTQLELVIWAAPLLIIIALGAITWTGTHLLDPYRPIGRVAAGRPLPEEVRPLDVSVVALDWKWLFIYPEYGIATVNDLAAPVDRPIHFRITSSAVMNSFYIPALAGQIYAMPGMETRLNAVINHAGDYEGFSANYSGAGFSGMRFTFRGLTAEGFGTWIDQARATDAMLDRPAYLALARPSQNEPARRWGRIDPDLYGAILNMCAEPGRMCMNEMMAIDARGGLGRAGIHAVLPALDAAGARVGAVFGPGPGFVPSICSVEEAAAAAIAARSRTSLAPAPAATPVRGAGLPRPSFTPAAPATTWLGGSRRPSDS
ncbi:ubiquinol oxidase subunit II [Plastoroseomonas hellenica]|uniref:ubiquinol oxidase subunit II n=1 Tax=Plastoroseomonas hellenica TaxID=2687306 RepID=UPI002012A0BF|nr:ubiquinol oxidase subunit II [Plastoroseomonas hellenica]MBR0644675.1 ubiquinol oxidase subunit II [Plastoroseomonas hellenica]